MSDPLALVPLAAAAGGGTINEFETQQLVAAGLTLLQRCAPLVRALSGRRSAILLPTCPAYFIALAASDGRGAVLMDPGASPLDVAAQIQDADVGAVFTITPLASRLPNDVSRVLLDDAPRSARYVGGGVTRDVDLGSHHGLTIEGDPDAPGRDEEAVIVYTNRPEGPPLRVVLSHRDLIANARCAAHAAGNAPDDRVLALVPFSSLFGLTVAGVAPLFAGGHVTTMSPFDASLAVQSIGAGRVTEVVGDPGMFSAVLTTWRALDAGKTKNLRLCICSDTSLNAELQKQWFKTTGVELRDASTVIANELRRQ